MTSFMEWNSTGLFGCFANPNKSVSAVELGLEQVLDLCAH